MKTRNQEIASDVFMRVTKHNSKSKKAKEEYKSMAERLPVLIQTAGLAQALSFVDARGNEMAKNLLDDLSNTLKRPNLSEDSRKAGNLQDYLYLTSQTMSALIWYKRFAGSVLGIQENENDDKTE